VVSAPYWFGDPTKTMPGGVHSVYDVSLPVSPLWMPPKPSDPGIDTTDWKWLFPGGGAWGITGEPRLSIHWRYIGLKLLGGAIILCPFALLIGRFLSRRDLNPARTPKRIKKKHNKSEMATPRKPSDQI